jgi:hypothetical protein
MILYFTKYWNTRGIYRVITDKTSDFISFGNFRTGHLTGYFGKDFFDNLKDAKERIAKLKENKIKNLKKQLNNFQEFEIDEIKIKDFPD